MFEFIYLYSSCPGLTRASTRSPKHRVHDVDTRVKPGHDGRVGGAVNALGHAK
jgi:hypothetical protein